MIVGMKTGEEPERRNIVEHEGELIAAEKSIEGIVAIEAIVEFIAEHVVASLDVYLRAVAGEEIHEPTDIGKEIALLGVELRTVEEPHRLTQAIQQQLFKDSIDPLFRETVRLLTPLCEFFSDNRITLGGTSGVP